MVRIIVLLVLLTSGGTTYAQYFQYSQYNFTGLRVNPALAGNTNYAEATFLHRTQNTGGDFRIQSDFLSGSYPLLHPSTGKPWSGLGILLHSDRTAAVFQVQEAALSYAVHLSVGHLQTLSFGTSVLFQNRSVKLDGFTTGSQYVPDRGFDRFTFSGENFSQFRGNHLTFSMGLQWQQLNRKGMPLHYFGISIFDINKPVSSFTDVQYQTPITTVANAGFRLFTANNLSIAPEALITFSANKVFTNFGARFQWELNDDPRTVGDRVDVITKFIPGRSGILGIQLHRKTISLGASYDFPVFGNNPSNQEAVEIGLQLRKPVKTRNQKMREKRLEEIARKKAERKVITKTTATAIDSINTVVTPVDPTSQSTPSRDSVNLHNAQPAVNVGPFAQQPMVVERKVLHFNFEFNSADLDDESVDFLKNLSQTLHQNELLSLIIEGHTDNVGSDKFNLRLSQRRADAVKHQLIKAGINPNRIKSEGKGMREPLNENLTDAQRADNRRVVLTLVQE
ncbi:MAG TPA: PorP/SprF family type IX secretion system membrane protein [Cyclobacteriaceae bacterium]|nr:PorP/SprF family type IX secretion system membrane protein [Cyclobacteriaceae bacterium]